MSIKHIQFSLIFVLTILIGISGCGFNKTSLVVEKTNSGLSTTLKNNSKPNIIIIMADDLGYEAITANGGESYVTPEIDQMAAEGIRIEHCYAQPLCTPSRVKLMTGIYNVHNYIEFGYLDTNQTTFGHIFKSEAYSTCVIGKWQLGKDLMSPHKAGFDEYCLWQVSQGRTDSLKRDTRFSKPILEINGKIKTFDDEDYGPDVVSQYGLDFIEKSVKNNTPFLLYYPMILTHCPFSPTPDSPEWLTDSTAVMTYKGSVDYFEDMVAYTDKIIGNINQKLRDLEIEDNTLVLFVGDNGTDKPVSSKLNGRVVFGAKGQSSDAGTRVPLIAKWNGTIPAGQVCHDLVDLSDILPTICEAARIDHPKYQKMDGKSFFPQLQGNIGKPRDWIYNWYSRSGEEDKAKIFVRNHRYKLYSSGEFYEIPEDYLEQNPLNTASLLGDTKTIFTEFKKVLEYYKQRRLQYVN